MAEMDAMAMINAVLEGLIQGTKDLKGSRGIPDTDQYNRYIDEWVKTFEMGLNSPLNAERKAHILMEAQIGIVNATMNCLADQCPRTDQHIFLARIFVMIEDLTNAVAKATIGDLLGNDEFMREVFGSGLN